MHVIFRADSGSLIGSGHVMRCLTLARQLTAKGADVSFICSNLDGNMAVFLQKQGITTHLINHDEPQKNDTEWFRNHWQEDPEQTIALLKNQPLKPDWLVVDHYGIDQTWEKALRPYVKHIMVIDDIANRPHDCDILLDQNYMHSLADRYEKLVPQHCQQLLSPRYALLREEFANARVGFTRNTDHVTNILVFLGGADTDNMTATVLDVLAAPGYRHLHIDVVIGHSNAHAPQLEVICNAHPNMTAHHNADMASLMAKADLCIGAGGTTNWERLCLGLPTLVIAIADNQIRICEALENDGFIRYLGTSDTVTAKYLDNALKKALGDPAWRKKAAEEGMKLIYGKGAKRAAQYLFSILPDYGLRPMNVHDREQVLQWRNASHVRNYMFNNEIIDLNTHNAWFEKALGSQNVSHMIFEFQGKPAGLVSFTHIDKQNHTCRWGFYLGEESLPQGTGMTMCLCALRYATRHLNTQHIIGYVLPHNNVSVYLHEALGFVRNPRAGDDDIPPEALRFDYHISQQKIS